MPRRHAHFIRVAALALASVVAVGGACAQGFAFDWNPRSGDAWVDAQLADINRYGLRYPEPFIDEMARYHGAPRELVGELLRRQWAPGDIYFACTLAQLAGRPCRYVAEQWERDHALGWGAIAQRMGIRPGSPGFHRLKRGFVPSFDRWGRPIELDASLMEDFPGRAGPAHGQGKPDEGDHAPPADGNGHGQGNGKGNGHGRGKRGHGDG